MRVTDIVFGAMIMVVVVVLATSAAVQMLQMSGGDATAAQTEYEQQYGTLLQDVNNVSTRAQTIQTKISEIKWDITAFIPGGEAIVEALHIVPDSINLATHAIGVAGASAGFPTDATGILIAAVVVAIVLGVINFLRGGGQL